MSVLPVLLLILGGIMIYAGLHNENPLTALKSVLSNKGK